ncbi:hypothetical protein Val02_93400 [Virgisporangium aliadipatigenens]|uniref:MFS transporter n=1 Tax=Virgisporangium aliadipatigenens TaxID=741659 RepID=A0A8J3YVI7_9ACTN|nr:MFS transporter [Virgisporangium aliadipatigenens]GIJ52454.1 hypothetical protein Val02_93400 [Virgisporangium aliadipatigenens]
MRIFWVWLGGHTVSLLGTQVLAFGMGWVAAGRSGILGGLVLTTITLARTLLLLVGGAVGDRFGVWRTMVAGDAVMLVVTVLVAVVARFAGTPAWLLLLAALAIGVVDAFYLPSSGSMPKRLVPGSHLARAMSARQLAHQGTAFLGAPVGGVVVSAVGLAGAALVDAFSFAAMLGVLLLLRPRVSAAAPAVARAGGGLLDGAVDGVRLMVADRLLRPMLLLVVVAAGVLLPIPSLLIPLLAHERRWSAGTAGVVVGAVALATAGVAVIVLMRGAGRRPGTIAALGLLVVAAGVLALAADLPLSAAVDLPMTAAAGPPVAAALLIGVGTGLFATHLGPLVLGSAPDTHLARVQSVVILAQSLPLVLTGNVLGATADRLGAPAALVACAVVLAATGAAALSAQRLRTATLPT